MAKKFSFVGQYQYRHPTGIKFNSKEGSIIQLRNGTLYHFCATVAESFIALDPVKGPFFKLNRDQFDKLNDRSYKVIPKGKEALDAQVDIGFSARKPGSRVPRKNKGGLPTKEEIAAIIERIDREAARPTFDGNDKRAGKYFKANRGFIQSLLLGIATKLANDGLTDSSFKAFPKSDENSILACFHKKWTSKIQWYTVKIGLKNINLSPFITLSVEFEDKYFEQSDVKRWKNSQVEKFYAKTFESLKRRLDSKFNLEGGPTKVHMSRITIAGFDGTIISWTSAI